MKVTQTVEIGDTDRDALIAALRREFQPLPKAAFAPESIVSFPFNGVARLGIVRGCDSDGDPCISHFQPNGQLDFVWVDASRCTLIELPDGSKPAAGEPDVGTPAHELIAPGPFNGEPEDAA